MTRLPMVFGGVALAGTLVALALVGNAAHGTADPSPPSTTAAPSPAAEAVSVSSTFPTTTVPATSVAPATTLAPDYCTLSTQLAVGDSSPEVECVEAELLAAGMLVGIEPDAEF